MTLREATAAKHKMAEQMPFNQKMLKGELSKEEYVKYLNSQFSIFYCIENLVTLPDNFLRVNRILSDIHELTNRDHVEINILEGVKNYCAHLKSLNEEMIWAHVYLNYMALLFGGQMLQKQVPGTAKMFDFENSHTIISAIREKQKDEWADEVNKGFDFMIEIFEELNNN